MLGPALAAILPEHFWDGFGGAVLGALAGGLLAVVGGYLATRHIRRLHLRRANDQAIRDYRAAVVIVHDELYTNRTVANNLAQGDHFVTDPSSIGLSDAAYLSVALALVSRLPEDTRNAVANAYADIHARDTLFDPMQFQAIGGGTAAVRKARQRRLERLVASIDGAIGALNHQRNSGGPRSRASALSGPR